MKFQLGQVVMTRGIANRISNDKCFEFLVQKCLSMHKKGNWGDLCDEDWNANQQALKDGERLFSSYYLDETQQDKIWIITEWDRSVTTILFPDEY